MTDFSTLLVAQVPNEWTLFCFEHLRHVYSVGLPRWGAESPFPFNDNVDAIQLVHLSSAFSFFSSLMRFEDMHVEVTKAGNEIWKVSLHVATLPWHPLTGRTPPRRQAEEVYTGLAGARGGEMRDPPSRPSGGEGREMSRRNVLSIRQRLRHTDVHSAE